MNWVVGEVTPFLFGAMSGVRFDSGIDAWVNDRVVVMCLMNYLFYVFSGALFLR